MSDDPTDFLDFQERFLTEDQCCAYLFKQRWPEGFRCPECGGLKAWALRSKPHVFECASCNRQTSVTAGTIMHRSKLPLRVWFWAAYLMATHSNGISALQLMKKVRIKSYKTAWLLCAKLRRAMVNPEREKLQGDIEIDETFIPFRPKSQHNVTPSRGRSTLDRIPVVGAVETVVYPVQRGRKVHYRSAARRVRLAVIDGTKQTDLHPFVKQNIELGSMLKADKWRGYNGLDGYGLERVDQRFTEAHVAMPHIHRVFALVKRWGLGVYHGLRAKHMQRYMEEFTFRFNRRRHRDISFSIMLGIAANADPMPYKTIIAT